MGNVRKQVANLALDLVAQRINYTAFLDALPPEAEESSDPDIILLLDRLEHEPAEGRLLGLSKKDMDEYRAQTQALIDKLQKG